VLHAWCTVCLVSALVSTLIFGLGIGEALASLQRLARVRLEQGWAGAWRALWGILAHRSRSGGVAAMS
jgi:divalent metal cation (Fe/Co/Zn/Cd) transporter